MRTWRLTLAVAATMAVLGGLTYTAAAQVDEPTTPAQVTTCVLSWDRGTLRAGSGEFIEERVRETYQAEADHYSSDPRLVGRATVKRTADNLSSSGDRMLTSEAIVIENDEGTWQGEATGYSTADDWATMVVLTGTGAYEGLSAVLVTRSTPDRGGETCSGLIFKGALPPVPALE